MQAQAAQHKLVLLGAQQQLLQEVRARGEEEEKDHSSASKRQVNI